MQEKKNPYLKLNCQKMPLYASYLEMYVYISIYVSKFFFRKLENNTQNISLFQIYSDLNTKDVNKIN